MSSGNSFEDCKIKEQNKMYNRVQISGTDFFQL